jgi:hypothetical protein
VSAFGDVAFGLAARPGAGLAGAGRREFDPGPAGFRKADGNSLFRVACAVFAFANMVHFLTHKLASLSGWSFAFAGIFTGSLNGFSFWHRCSPCYPKRTSGPNPLRLGWMVTPTRRRRAFLAADCGVGLFDRGVVEVTRRRLGVGLSGINLKHPFRSYPLRLATAAS